MKSCAFCLELLEDDVFECPKCHKSVFGPAPRELNSSTPKTTGRDTRGYNKSPSGRPFSRPGSRKKKWWKFWKKEQS